MSVINPPASRWRPAPSVPLGLVHPLPEPARDAAPVLASRDYSRLRPLARLWHDRDHPAGRLLADKLDGCRVLPPDAVPASVAVLGARVTFAVEGSAPETRRLVMPEEGLPGGQALPVSTPLGAVLLGLAAGDWAEAPGPDGRRCRVRLLMVEGRCPGAGGRAGDDA